MIATGLIGNWAVATGLLVLFLIHVARPVDFVAAFLMVVAGASWVSNTGGQLTLELSLLTSAILLRFACNVLSSQDRALSISRTTLTWWSDPRS